MEIWEIVHTTEIILLYLATTLSYVDDSIRNLTNL